MKKELWLMPLALFVGTACDLSLPEKPEVKVIQLQANPPLPQQKHLLGENQKMACPVGLIPTEDHKACIFKEKNKIYGIFTQEMILECEKMTSNKEYCGSKVHPPVYINGKQTAYQSMNIEIYEKLSKGRDCYLGATFKNGRCEYQEGAFGPFTTQLIEECLNTFKKSSQSCYSPYWSKEIYQALVKPKTKIDTLKSTKIKESEIFQSNFITYLSVSQNNKICLISPFMTENLEDCQFLDFQKKIIGNFSIKTLEPQSKNPQYCFLESPQALLESKYMQCHFPTSPRKEAYRRFPLKISKVFSKK